MNNTAWRAASLGLLVVALSWVMGCEGWTARRIAKGVSSRWYDRHVRDYEYVYLDPADSVPAYLKVYPKGEIHGLLVMLEGIPGGRPGYGEMVKLHGLAAAAGIMTVYMEAGDSFQELLLSDATSAAVDTAIQHVVATHDIPRNNVVIGGQSLGGTLAVKYAEYCASGRCEAGFTPAGVFGVDAPLDWERFWWAHVRWIERAFHPSPKGEAEWVLPIMRRVFGGAPDENREAYRRISPFLYSAENGGNIALLANTPIRLYTEPDVNWWIETRRVDYYGMNAVDSAAIINQLKLLGNDRAELITTTGKGYFWRDGTRHPHTWSIVDERDLLEWMREIFERDA